MGYAFHEEPHDEPSARSKFSLLKSLKEIGGWLLSGTVTLLTVALIYHTILFWPVAKYACTSVAGRTEIQLDHACMAKSLFVIPAATRTMAERNYERDFGTIARR